MTRRRPALWPAAVFAALLAVPLAAPVESQTQSMTTSRQKVTPDPEQENALPRQLRELGWDQKMGAPVPLDLSFVDHRGETVQLRELLAGRPILLAPVYYDCPMLCSLVLDGVTRGLKPLRFTPGTEFDVVAVSFDPREGPDLAERSRNTALARYGRSEGDASGWHFLTGEQTAITALMDAIGFRYEFDEETGLYGHAGGVVLLTPEGRISRYFYGVDYAPKDLKLGLVEASNNEIGSVVEQVLLFCYQYDPALGKYSAVTMNLVRIAGGLTVLLIAFLLFRSFRAERSAERSAEQRVEVAG